MADHLHSILVDTGMDPREADLYLCVLEHGVCAPGFLAKITGFKRSTVYGLLEAMTEKGYISAVETKGTLHYQAVPPQQLVRHLETSLASLRDHLPELAKVSERSVQLFLPTTQTFRDTEGITAIFADCARSKEAVYAYLPNTQGQKLLQEFFDPATVTLVEFTDRNLINFLLYGNRIAYIDWEQMTGFVIESQQLADLQRLLVHQLSS